MCRSVMLSATDYIALHVILHNARGEHSNARDLGETAVDNTCMRGRVPHGPDFFSQEKEPELFTLLLYMFCTP